jgi:hypothetical protein
LRYTEDINYDVEPESASEITAALTTANARIRLMNMLLWLGQFQLDYCDTDGVFYSCMREASEKTGLSMYKLRKLRN